ncbi:MAG: glycosyltransferase family 4 protein [Chloroflexi bacterium]|nr:glycosyltransferase family 4 protein [Chloroflexota bacterium]
MKILVLNYEYPPVGGGGGRASADLCSALVARGHQIKVLTSHHRSLPMEETIDGCNIIRVPSGRKDLARATFVSMAGFIVGGFLPGYRLIKSWKPNVIHVHFAVPTGVLAWLLSIVSGVPYVLTAHLGDIPGGVPAKTDGWFRLVYPFTPQIWKRATSVVAVSAYTRKLAQEHYKVPVAVIPNGVPLLDKADLMAMQKVHTPTRIIFAGRFQPQKNLLFLIEVLSTLRDIAWTCTFLGDGPQRVAIESLIESHKLRDRIKIGGWVPSDEVWENFGRSDILALPSKAEGLPVVGVYALSRGLAIVANEIGGLAELVDDRVNGRLCAVDDKSCFENALRWCLEDEQRLMRLKAASFSKSQQFDIRHVAQSYEAVLQEAIP